jgi:hypothetical protein
MLKHDSKGRPKSSYRRINTRMSAELLVGDGWQGVAYAELRRLSMEAAAYHSQLEDLPGYEETGRAVEALKEAYKAIDEAYGSDDDDEDDDGGLWAHLKPE